MEIEKLIENLILNSFKVVERESLIFDFDITMLDTCNDRGFYLFYDSRRFVVVKKYEVFHSLEKKFEEDLAFLHSIHNYLINRYKSNLYYFVCLTCEILPHMGLFINKFEKNDLVCKKNVFIGENDFERIPFLDFSLSVPKGNDQDKLYLEYMNKSIKDSKHFSDLEKIWASFQENESPEIAAISFIKSDIL